MYKHCKEKLVLTSYLAGVFQTTIETYEEEAEVETDEEVEETVEKEVVKDVVQEVKVPQVKALHPFSGQGLKMVKGEVGGVISFDSKTLLRVGRIVFPKQKARKVIKLIHLLSRNGMTQHNHP